MATRPPSVDNEWEDVTSEWQTISQPEQPELEPAQKALAGAESISETPFFQREILGAVSPEKAAELFPAIGGTLGAALGNVPGALLGSAGGELIRQLSRRAAGFPGAPGLVANAMGMDPNSPEAAAAGIVAEATGGAAGEQMARLIGAMRGGLNESALRSISDLIPGLTKADKKKALQYAARIESENIAPAFSTQAGQIKKAAEAKAKAEAERDLLERGLATKTAPTIGVVSRVEKTVPKKLPTGEIPLVGKAERKAAENALSDVKAAIGGRSEMTLEEMLSERRRWDKYLKDVYARGALNAPAGKVPAKVASDAWRTAINDSFPQLAEANAKVSDLIRINELMKEYQAKLAREGLVSTESKAAAAGAGVVGRMSIPAMSAATYIARTAGFKSLSAGGKKLMSKLLAAPEATTQAWVRMGDFFGPHIEGEK